MTKFKRVEIWCFLLLLVNLATAGADFYFRRAAASLVPLPPGNTVSATPGITAAGSPPEYGPACHLVRYASVYCGYCSPKFSQPWNNLEAALVRKGCDAIIVTPYSGDFPLSDGKSPEQKLAAVSLPFVKSTRFSSTPITLLVDRNWKILWSHVGVLGDDDNQQAMGVARF